VGKRRPWTPSRRRMAALW